MIYKALDRKLEIAQQEPQQKLGVNSGTPEGLVVPAPHVTPAVLLYTNII